MTEADKRYRKTKQKRLYLNLTLKDYDRWCSYASVVSLPVSTMIRRAVEKEILEMEDSFESDIVDIRNYQDSLKVR